MNWVFNLWNGTLPQYGASHTCMFGMALTEKEDRLAFIAAASIDYLGNFPQGTCEIGASGSTQEVKKWTPVHEIWHLLLEEDDVPDPQPVCPAAAIDQSVHYYDCLFNPPVGFSGWLGAEKIVAIRADVSKWEE
ncbi:hypothetical protein IIA16_07020 [bacterium]|nr:hypothetical protein [bacterium]